MIQYILTTFNHVMRFVTQVDELVKTVERNIQHYFPTSDTSAKRVGATSTEIVGATAGVVGGNILFRKEHKLLHDEITKSESEFKRQSHFLVVMLTAMQKHGASPHVAEILTQLNFNYFYHQQDSQQQQPFTQRSARPERAP